MKLVRLQSAEVKSLVRFFLPHYINLAKLTEDSCPCCGQDKVKRNSYGYQCDRATSCPLANRGGYFYTEDKDIFIEIGKKAYSGKKDIKKLQKWADRKYRTMKLGTIDTKKLKIDDIGTIVNSKHSWNNGKKVVIIKIKNNDITCRSLKPDGKALFFLKQNNIKNFNKEWLKNTKKAVGKTVIMKGKVEQHQSNIKGLKTEGVKVKIIAYNDEDKQWVAESSKNRMYTHYGLSPKNFKPV